MLVCGVHTYDHIQHDDNMATLDTMSTLHTITSLEIFSIHVHTKAAKLRKNGAALKLLGVKSCGIKGGGQEMAAMMLMLINLNNAHSHY